MDIFHQNGSDEGASTRLFTSPVCEEYILSSLKQPFIGYQIIEDVLDENGLSVFMRQPCDRLMICPGCTPLG